MVFGPNRKKTKDSRGFARFLDSSRLWPKERCGINVDVFQNLAKTSRILDVFTIWLKNHCKYHGNCNTIVKKSKILEGFARFGDPESAGIQKTNNKAIETKTLNKNKQYQQYQKGKKKNKKITNNNHKIIILQFKEKLETIKQNKKKQRNIILPNQIINQIISGLKKNKEKTKTNKIQES